MRETVNTFRLQDTEQAETVLLKTKMHLMHLRDHLKYFVNIWNHKNVRFDIGKKIIEVY